MFDTYEKVFFYRFDLSFPSSSVPETDLSRNDKLRCFLRRLNKRVMKHYPKKMRYSWCAEIEKSKQHHYHIVLMLNGHKIQEPKRLQSWIRQIWMELGGSSPSWVKYYRINRKDAHPDMGLYDRPKRALEEGQDIGSMVYHCSYLFKLRGKGFQQDNSHNYGHSR